MGVVARCGNTGVTVGSEWCGLCRVHGCEGYKSYKQKRKNKKQGREEQMVLNEFVEELDIAIKQDGHDIYCNAETAEMLKSLINDVEKHKICTIYATPPNDTKKVDELLKNTGFHIATGYDDNGKFRYEVFEKDSLK